MSIAASLRARFLECKRECTVAPDNDKADRACADGSVWTLVYRSMCTRCVLVSMTVKAVEHVDKRDPYYDTIAQFRMRGGIVKLLHGALTQDTLRNLTGWCALPLMPMLTLVLMLIQIGTHT